MRVARWAIWRATACPGRSIRRLAMSAPTVSIGRRDQSSRCLLSPFAESGSGIGLTSSRTNDWPDYLGAIRYKFSTDESDEIATGGAAAIRGNDRLRASDQSAVQPRTVFLVELVCQSRDAVCLVGSLTPTEVNTIYVCIVRFLSRERGRNDSLSRLRGASEAKMAGCADAGRPKNRWSLLGCVQIPSQAAQAQAQGAWRHHLQRVDPRH